jgi:hypothetical protein
MYFIYIYLNEIKLYKQKMSEKKTFFLISNGSSELYGDNTLTKFKNRLPEILELPESDNWVAAVESVGFSCKFKNVHIPENKLIPSFILGNCKKNVPYTREERCKTLHHQELCATIDFDFKNNEDGQNCIWTYHYFEDKMYTQYEMYQYFYDLMANSNLKQLYTYYDDKTGRLEFDNTGNVEKGTSHYWLLIHPSMIHTFGIPITPLLITGNEYWKRVGHNKYALIKIGEYGQEEELNSNTPFTTYYKNEKYFAYDMYCKYPRLYCNPSSVFTDPDRRYPKVIKILCDKIKPQIFNSTHSQDLIVFCPDFNNKKDKYYFVEFENQQYVSLSNSILSDFEVRLCDEENNKLQLLTGVPSIVKLSIKKMEEQAFNVRLTSSKTKEITSNTNSSFKVRLPNTLSLNRNWSVALTSINHPNIFSTFLEKSTTRSILFKYIADDGILFTTVKFSFEKDRTYSKNEIINNLNDFFVSSNIGVVYLSDRNKVEMLFKYQGELIISNYILQLLGYNGFIDHDSQHPITRIVVDGLHNSIRIQSITDTEDHYILEFKTDMDLDILRPDYVIAYSNIVSSSIIGGAYSKILRIIPIYKTEEDYVIKEFRHKEFIELQNTEIVEIEIELRSHDGSLVNFATKKDVILNLEFKHGPGTGI